MQSQQLSYRDLGRAVCSSVKHGGILSLWRGVGPTLLRDVPFSCKQIIGPTNVNLIENHRELIFTK